MNKQELIEAIQSMRIVPTHEQLGDEGVKGINFMVDEAVGIVEQLDESETLSPKWIANNEIEGLLINGDEYEMVVPVEKVQKLLQPKQDVPVIPQFVADWFEENKEDLEYGIYDVITDVHDKLNNEELSEIEKWFDQRYVDDVKHKPVETVIRMQGGYEIEEEPKYIVPIIRNLYLKQSELNGNWGVGSHPSELKTTFTEQEIKDYDERYWAFAEEVTNDQTTTLQTRLQATDDRSDLFGATRDDH